MQLLKWLLLVFGTLLILAVLVLQWRSERSMDQNYRHSAATAELPLFSETAADGLVRIAANGLEFRARVAGFGPDSQDRPTVILLHGFPVTSAMWLDLIPVLSDLGYRVLALDQRGYSPGARPEGKELYRIDLLSEDVTTLADALEIERFHLIGHDWGAIVGWYTVMRFPERIISWTGMSVPHPVAFDEAIKQDSEQRERSVYMLLFRTPWLAETVFSQGGLELLKRTYSSMSDTQRKEYLEVFAEPGALTAAFNWYRAMDLGAAEAIQEDVNVSLPSLFIWGRNDVAIGEYGVRAQSRFMKGDYRLVELDAGHWLLRERPAETIEAIVTHLMNNGANTSPARP